MLCITSNNYITLRSFSTFILQYILEIRGINLVSQLLTLA